MHIVPSALALGSNAVVCVNKGNKKIVFFFIDLLMLHFIVPFQLIIREKNYEKKICII